MKDALIYQCSEGRHLGTVALWWSDVGDDDHKTASVECRAG